MAAIVAPAVAHPPSEPFQARGNQIQRARQGFRWGVQFLASDSEFDAHLGEPPAYEVGQYRLVTKASFS